MPALPPCNRGGSSSGQHIDILGNAHMLMDVLAIVSGRGKQLQDEYVSDIASIAQLIDFEDE